MINEDDFKNEKIIIFTIWCASERFCVCRLKMLKLLLACDWLQSWQDNQSITRLICIAFERVR